MLTSIEHKIIDFINYFDTKTHGFNRVDKSQHDSTLNFKNIFFLDNN